MKKVYIASPYTNGDKLEMVRLQIDAWHILRDRGLIPIAPLLTHYINEVRERDHKDWLCLLYTSPSPRDRTRSRMPSSA